jgi:hypothetical protein
MSTPETATQSSATPTFTLFPKLTSELRLHIWELALQPRVIKAFRGLCDDKGHIIDLGVALKPIDAAPPALLHTNHESRFFAQRSYTLAFKDPFREAIYFDFQRDTLCLERWMNVYIRREDAPKLRHLEIRTIKVLIYDSLRRARRHFMLFEKFCYLETLSILTPPNDNYPNLVNDFENAMEMDWAEIRMQRYSDEQAVKKCKIEWRDCDLLEDI